MRLIGAFDHATAPAASSGNSAVLRCASLQVASGARAAPVICSALVAAAGNQPGGGSASDGAPLSAAKRSARESTCSGGHS